MSNSIVKRPNFFVRAYINASSSIYRAYQRLVADPEHPEHGASYAAPYGVRQPFSPATSMSAYSGHAYTHACATRASQDLSALPLSLSLIHI